MKSMIFTMAILFGKSAAAQIISFPDYINSSVKVNHEAVFLITKKESLLKIDKQYINKRVKELGEITFEAKGLKVPACTNQKFTEDLAFQGSCSSFLIAPDLVATAGHCADNVKNFCKENVFVKNFYGDKKLINEEDVMECDSVIYQEDNLNNNVGDFIKIRKDFAVIKLKKKVQDVKPVEMATPRKMKKNDKVLAVGFPVGMPMKFSTGIIESVGLSSINTRIPIATGNSGGPLFDLKTGKVIGIASQAVGGEVGIKPEINLDDITNLICWRVGYADRVKFEKTKKIINILK